MHYIFKYCVYLIQLHLLTAAGFAVFCILAAFRSCKRSSYARLLAFCAEICLTNVYVFRTRTLPRHFRRRSRQRRLACFFCLRGTPQRSIAIPTTTDRLPSLAPRGSSVAVHTPHSPNSVFPFLSVIAIRHSDVGMSPFGVTRFCYR